MLSTFEKEFYLGGPIGCGKTSLMKLVNYFFPREIQYAVKPARKISFEFEKEGFMVINFEDIRKSFRCNPLAPEWMESPIDAFESSHTVLYNLNREWIRRQGEFFSESAVPFFAAVIWFLKKYKDGG